MVRVHDIRSSYLLNLRALELASERVKEACRGNDIEAAAVEAHFALHAIYDLNEAYFVPRGVPSRRDQDDIYSQEGGQVAAGLVLARGARTHQLVTFPTPGGFPDKPYGMGPYGPGWIWKDHNWTDHRDARRAAWYQKRVGGRLLWSPLDEAWGWFLTQVPD